MLPIKLETGMFGVMSDGDQFVVVNDKLVYRNGDWDYVSEAEGDRLFGYCVDKVWTGLVSFNCVARASNGSLHDCETLVYERCLPVKMTLSEIAKRLGIKNIEIVEE